MSQPVIPPKVGNQEQINILLVDDIPETRENIKKLLAFESDFKVVGSAGTGTEGITLAKQLKPNIIIMDINMPDMDGIQATSEITEAVPTAAVIMMSAHGDPDYLRRAMLAGARNFLTKPPDPEELYNTIREVHRRNIPIAEQYERMSNIVPEAQPRRAEGAGDRAGHIIVVYSPKGGVGCTTIATNLASGLMKEDVRVLLVDADMQFGDVGLFLNLQGPRTIVDLVATVDDFDVDLFENVTLTHESGLKVLMAPARPEFADEIQANPTAPAQILEKIANNYDFIIVDTSHQVDDVLLSILDIASKIVLVTAPTLASLKNVRFVIDLFDKLEYPQNKIDLVVNYSRDERGAKKTTIINNERIEKFLARSIKGEIPFVDDRILLTAISKGVPVIVAERDQRKSPVKEMLAFSDYMFQTMMGDELSEAADEHEDDKKRGGLRLRLGRT
ncbi:MAG: response regulator [Chloroflexi bacterium]|nr:MAG: histidine kinase [Phototrophicales bacterium]RMF82302.1 MAG: response regulator [Chloroflexota bacterium]